VTLNVNDEDDFCVHGQIFEKNLILGDRMNTILIRVSSAAVERITAVAEEENETPET